jgi:transcriptional regulator with XRE-family HTH domain
MCTERTRHPVKTVHTVRMTPLSDRPGHFIRAWRKHRGLTLERLAERIGMSHQNLGKIERFLVPYNQELLETLALELRCAPADLITRDPSDPEGLWSVIDALKPAERRQAIRLIEALKSSGT